MKTSTIVIISLLAVLLLITLITIGSYNGFVKKNQNVETAWSQVENQYQRRFDLIPNLVNSVKGMMKQEQEVFESIAEARTQYAGASNINSKIDAAQNIETSLGRLLAIMENYPELKSSQNVTGLMDELSGTENRISVERNRYNENVRTYNVSVKTFPSNIFANIFGFETMNFFESTENANIAPEVNI
ncbi:MAG: LemA family protein [Methanogenium sp.]|jgi:LemA protein